jgi:spore coat protein A
MGYVCAGMIFQEFHYYSSFIRRRKMLTRRQFLAISLLTGARLVFPTKWSQVQALRAEPGLLPASVAAALAAMLDPTTVPKYVTELIRPPAMPRTSEIALPDSSLADYYELTVRQFTQHILPSSMGLNPTPIWSYVVDSDPTTFNYPAFTIEADWEKPVRVKWINGLVDGTGNYLPHLLPVDQTVHWANPLGPPDTEGTSQDSYTGPVPMVTHVHGAHTAEESDGYPEAWYLPDANNIPAGYAEKGTFYDPFKNEFNAAWGETWEKGSATFQYGNDQRATTLWYHDHSLGITRVNVYAGPAGFYLIRGGSDDLPVGVLPGPAPGVGDDPFGSYYEIPIVIQDRSFNDDGTLFYPDARAFFEGLEPEQLNIPFTPDLACDGEESDVSAIWNPEFFGNTIVVNGRTWPYLDVEKRRYRFRFLNGTNSRFLTLKLVTGDPAAPRPVTPALPFWQIGSEGGFLPQPVQLDQLLVAPAERADVIVDFTDVAEGTEVYLINEAPDEPFGGGAPGIDFDAADPLTTGQVMKFVVGPIVGSDTSTAPASLVLPTLTPLGAADNTRKVSLNEEESAHVRVVADDGTITLACDDPEAEVFGPTEALLGSLPGGVPVPLHWMADVTEDPTLGSTEIWEIYNFTMDAHPIHVHLVQFQVVNRQALQTGYEGTVALPAQPIGDPRDPEAWETGYKDTVIAYPGEVTRIKARFDEPGLFVWHCHILEHEDNEMMRPYKVMQRIYLPFVAKE